MSDLERFDSVVVTMQREGHILVVDIKYLVPILLDESQVNWITEH
jgi:hypothetical protein